MRKVEINFKTRPTEKQLEFIADIEYYTGIPFVGETRAEAIAYINEMIEEYKFCKERKGMDNGF